MVLGICVVVVGVLLVIHVVREHLLPRRYGRRLAETISRALGFEWSRNKRGDMVVAGQLDGCRVEISVSPVGYAVVSVQLSDRAVPMIWPSTRRRAGATRSTKTASWV